MKRVVIIIISVLFSAVGSFSQSKKELLIKMDETVNSLSQQVKDLQKQVDELKALIVASNESNLIGMSWTKRGGFFSGRALVQDDSTNKYGFIDKAGKVVIPCEWQKALDFNNDGWAKVQNANELWGLINVSGKEIIPCKWKHIEGFDLKIKGLSEVWDANGLRGFIDKTGKEVIPCKYQGVGDFFGRFEGQAWVTDVNGLYGLIDKTGKEVVPCKWKRIESGYFKDLVRVLDEHNLYGFVDTKTGTLVIPCRYVDIKTSRFPNRAGAKKSDGRWVLIDNTGKEYPYKEN